MLGPYLPEQGGNVDLLTQIYWPTVHPSLQEKRKEVSMAKVENHRICDRCGTVPRRFPTPPSAD